MNNPLVSWLMPVYNSEKFLRRSLDSMLNQTYKEFEIIIVLENSCTDNSRAICEEYAARDNRVKVHYKVGELGIAKSLNQGLKACRGKYIARMDADDFSYPERLEKQVAYMEQNADVGILGARVRIISGEGIWVSNEDSTPSSEEIGAKLLFETCIVHPTVMFRAEIFDNGLEYPENNKAEDYALWASLISKVKISIFPDILVDYYVHGENVCTVNFDKLRADSVTVSRNALQRELGVDTSDYPDSLFGWRTNDPIPSDIKKYMMESLELLKTVRNANNQLGKFDAKTMEKVLNDEWKKTLQVIAPYGEIDCLKLPLSQMDNAKIESALQKLDDRVRYDKKLQIIVYGTGRYCKELVRNLRDEDYPFEIIAFCDSDRLKQGKPFNGLPIIAPDNIQDYKYDYISIAAPLYEQEIKNSLLNEYGIEPGKILDLPLRAIAFHYRRKLNLERYKSKHNARQAYLFCAPDYGNLGDHAIAAAEHCFFEKHLDIRLEEVPFSRFNEVISIIKMNSRPEDLVLITGGGFLGSLWEDLEYQVRRIITMFPDNPVIILPQTLYWEESDKWSNEKVRTRQVYESHRKLVLCARDTETYRIMRETYPKCKVITAPDMVLAYGWKEFINRDTERESALLCLKTDKESILTDRDWERLKEIAAEACGTASVCSTNLDEMISEKRRDVFLRMKLDEFSRARLVITDRLHGLLFSVITGTPCVAMNNCNHKLRATFEWVKHIPNLRFADSIDKVKHLAKEVLSVGQVEYCASDFRDHFKELEMTVELLIDNKGQEAKNVRRY